MFKKISFFMVFLASLTAIEYEIHDIGTLQTHSSQAIAINNQGQILGWYNVDGADDSKHFFLRERNEIFHEIPKQDKATGVAIDWRYLIDSGKVYGIHDHGRGITLFIWDQRNGIVNMGSLPGKEISAINNVGQVLIKFVEENENGKSIRRPAIWHNGVVTKLKGLEGDVGIESEESVGLDMNNRGEVVGYSIAYLSYKNEIYNQKHAVKWINGQAIDLHKEVPKSMSTSATAVNDLGDVVIGSYLIRSDGQIRSHHLYSGATATDTKYFFHRSGNSNFLDRNEQSLSFYPHKIIQDYDCIWMTVNTAFDMNDNGDVVAQGTTVYGEKHIMLLTPIKS